MWGWCNSKMSYRQEEPPMTTWNLENTKTNCLRMDRLIVGRTNNRISQRVFLAMTHLNESKSILEHLK